MKSFFDLKEQTIPGKTVVFTFGRFQPPTRGHQLVFDTVKNHADKIGAEHRIYFSRTDPSVLTTSKESFAKKTERAQQNPLSPDVKHRILKTLFPSHNFVSNPEVKTALHVLKHLSDDGVEHAIFVGDTEREELANQMQKYAGHPDFPNVKKVSFVKSGDRDPDSDGNEGISGTKARAAAIAGDHDAFHAMMPEGTDKDTSKKIMGMISHSVNKTKVAIDQMKAAQPKKKVKEDEDHEEFDLGSLLLEKVKDRTRKKRDHKMYGWGKKNPSAKQLANRKKKSKRTVARRKANESGRTEKGDKSVELDHKNGNANDNSSDNLRVISRHKNRSRNNNKWRK